MVHPADLHFFAPMIAEVERRGDSVVVTTRVKDVLVELADEAGLNHEVLSSAGQRSRLREANELFTRVRKLCVLIRRHRVDLVMSRNPSGTMAARLMRVPSMYDTDDGPAVGVLYWAAAIPATTITSPAAGGVDYGRKHLVYDGFKETASLRPERFRPDHEVVRSVGLDPDVAYSVVRAVAMEASHDHGEDGLDDETLRTVVAELAPLGPVWISSERSVSPCHRVRPGAGRRQPDHGGRGGDPGRAQPAVELLGGTPALPGRAGTARHDQRVSPRAAG